MTSCLCRCLNSHGTLACSWFPRANFPKVESWKFYGPPEALLETGSSSSEDLPGVAGIKYFGRRQMTWVYHRTGLLWLL